VADRHREVALADADPLGLEQLGGAAPQHVLRDVEVGLDERELVAADGLDDDRADGQA
jgi:hypothetical protein